MSGYVGKRIEFLCIGFHAFRCTSVRHSNRSRPEGGGAEESRRRTQGLVLETEPRFLHSLRSVGMTMEVGRTRAPGGAPYAESGGCSPPAAEPAPITVTLSVSGS